MAHVTKITGLRERRLQAGGHQHLGRSIPTHHTPHSDPTYRHNEALSTCISYNKPSICPGLALFALRHALHLLKYPHDDTLYPLLHNLPLPLHHRLSHAVRA